MAERHKVKFSVPNRDLGYTDIVFKVWDRLDDTFIGELRVSVGGIEWRGSRQRRTYTYQQDWTEFEKLLEGTISRRRKKPKTAPRPRTRVRARATAPRRRARTASRKAPSKARRR